VYRLRTQFTCNNQCHCEYVPYSPICSFDGKTTFISACHAGCSNFTLDDKGSKVSVAWMSWNKNCLLINFSYRRTEIAAASRLWMQIPIWLQTGLYPPPAGPVGVGPSLEPARWSAITRSSLSWLLWVYWSFAAQLEKLQTSLLESGACLLRKKRTLCPTSIVFKFALLHWRTLSFVQVCRRKRQARSHGVGIDHFEYIRLYAFTYLLWPAYW